MGPTSVHGIQTQAIHAGLVPDPETGAILTPIYQSTTFVQPAVGESRGYTYTRSGNPTVAALERHLGALEDAPPAAAFATGMAAITALLLAELESGGHVVASRAVYGGTVRLLRRVLDRFGVRATFVDASDAAAIAAAIRPATRLVFVESPANPTLELADIGAAAAAAREAGALLVVDNTFMTPVLQRPLDLGAGAVVYSTTKLFDGHNATVGGAVVSRDERLLERLRFIQNATGVAQAPFEAFLTLQGMKTLPLRIERQSESALRIARFLAADARVERVVYPWLEDFPQAALARAQQRAGGCVVSFEVEGGARAGVRLMNSVRLCALAENLGSVQTLVTHPASMTHASMTPDERRAAGIADGLVRLSVGLEDPEDLIADLDAALAEAVR